MVRRKYGAPEGSATNRASADLGNEMSSLKSRLLAGGAWALAARGLIALTGLALSALLSRLLSPQDLGIFFLVFSLVMLCTLFSTLGLETTIVRLVAENFGLEQLGRARDAVIKSFVLGGLGALIVGTCYLLFGGNLAARLFDAPALATITSLTVAWILLMTLQRLLGETFRGFHDFRLASIFGRSLSGFGSLVTGLILVTVLSLLWLSRDQTSLTMVMLTVVLATLASVLLAGWLLIRKVRNLPSDEKDEEVALDYAWILQATWPLLVTDLMLFAVTQADLWIVGAFRAPEEIAVYGAAIRLVSLVVTPLLIVNAVVPPIIAENYARGSIAELQRVLRTTATLGGIPAFIVLLCFIFMGGPILGLIFGDYYREGAAVLAVLSLGYIVSVWTGSCGVTMSMTGHQKVLMNITIATGSFTIVAGLLTVNYYGMLGVAAAAAAGLALQNVALWLSVRLTTGMWTHVAIESIPAIVKAVQKR